MRKVPPGLFLLLTYFASTFGRKEPSIIIIGAGPAGIAAATRLLENNFKNLTILEAEPRIGGRVNSVKFGDAYIDLGAQWCHGQKGNIVYTLVKDLNILKPSTFSLKMFHSSKKVIDDEFAGELINIMESVYEASNENHHDHVSIGEYCTKNYNKSIYEKYGANKEKLEIALAALDHYQHAILSFEGSFSWFDPSAKTDYRDCEGDNTLNWNGLGYKTILDVMMKKYPDPKQQLPIDDKILLNKEVVSIRWNSNVTKEGVTVSCSDQSVYTADHVIFTASIGVLKDKSAEMFIPGLPHSKHEAIQNIGFGGVMKVFMQYSKSWWNESVAFNFIWTEEDKRAALKEFPEGPNSNGEPWVADVFNLDTVDNNPNVLVAWITGNLVPAIEQLPDETIINGIDYVLNRFMGDKYTISKPEKIVRSQWCSNPHFQGVYSFQSMKTKKGNDSSENDLAMPIKNIENRPLLQFAGEATHPYYFSTVHGAIETGHREADALINTYP